MEEPCLLACSVFFTVQNTCHLSGGSTIHTGWALPWQSLIKTVISQSSWRRFLKWAPFFPEDPSLRQVDKILVITQVNKIKHWPTDTQNILEKWPFCTLCKRVDLVLHMNRLSILAEALAIIAAHHHVGSTMEEADPPQANQCKENRGEKRKTINKSSEIQSTQSSLQGT